MKDQSYWKNYVYGTDTEEIKGSIFQVNDKSKLIYLDYNATTLIDPGVRDAMLPYLEEHFGNPSSGYVYEQRAKKAVEKAGVQVAALIEAGTEEIVFTGGGKNHSGNTNLTSGLIIGGRSTSFTHALKTQQSQ